MVVLVGVCICALFFGIHNAHATYCITSGSSISGYARTGQGCPATSYTDCRALPFSSEQGVSGWNETRGITTKSFCTNGGKNCSSQWTNGSYTYGTAHGFCQGKQCVAPFAPLIDDPKLGTPALNASINDQIESCFNQCPQPDICGVAVGPIPATSTSTQLTINGLVAGSGFWNGTYPWSYYMSCGGYTAEGAIPLGDRISVAGHFDNIASNQNCSVWFNGINGFVAQKTFQVQRNIPSAQVTSFTANGDTGTIYINSGDTVRLDWTTLHVNTVSLTSSPNDSQLSSLASQVSHYANGNVTNLRPRVDTTYTIIGTNEAGSTSPQSITVKIGKPFVTGFTINGTPNKVVIFIGQEIRFDWDTQSTESVHIDGMSSDMNNQISSFTAGNITGFKPTASGTYTLKPYNRQWGWGDPISVDVDVRYVDLIKAAHCGFDSLLKGGTTGVTLGSQWGAIAAFVGTLIAPAVGTIIGGVGGFVGGLIAGGILGVVNFVTCYFFDYYIGPDLIAAIQGGIIQGGLSVQGTPSFTPPSGPPSIDLTQCPPGKCTIGNWGGGTPPIKADTSSGPLIVHEGGADEYANYLMKISAENSARTHPDKLYASDKISGYKELPSNYTLTYKQAKTIIGHCGANGLSRSCMRNDVQAVLNITLTDDEFNRMLRSLNIFAGVSL